MFLVHNLFLVIICKFGTQLKISARATFSMLTLLTLVGMFGSLSSSTPQISYTTKMDTWMVASVIFVFTTLLELVTVLVYKMNLNDQNKTREATNQNAWKRKTDKSQDKPDITEGKMLVFAERCFVTVYFAAFIIFCIHYWITI